MNAQRKVRVILGATKFNIPRFLVVLQAIYAGMSGNPSIFVSPPVLFTLFLNQIQSLAKSEQELRQRIGTASARNVLRDAVFVSVEALRTYVQGLCDPLSLEQATSLALAAGLKLAATRRYAKPPLGVKLTGTAGSALLEANALLLSGGKKSQRKTYFNWEWSADGKSWTSVPPTALAHTTITGLPLLTVCSFRVSVTSSLGQGAWTEAVTLLIH